MKTEGNAPEENADPPISAAGRRQAEQLGKSLRSRQITQVYSSDLKRARETARIIADSLHVPLDLRPEFRELSCVTPEAIRGNEQTISYAIDDILGRLSNSAIVVVAHSGTIRAIARHLLRLPLGIFDVPSVANGEVLVLQKSSPGTWTSAG